VIDPLPRLALFARLLRDAGLRTGPDRLIDASAALACVDVGSMAEVRDALRAVFVGRHEEVEVYDAAFDLFWSDPTGTLSAGAMPQRGRSLPVDPDRAREWMALLQLPSSQLGAEQEGEPSPVSSSGYSAEELLRHRDFREMTWEETLQVRRLLRQAPWRVAERRTRRRRTERRGSVDLRRTMRLAARHGGEAVQLARLRQRTTRRPMVILCDVSGSMDRYSRQLLVFAHAIGHRQRVETFAFSTHLTRITHLLRRGDVDDALDHVAAQVHDIGGGTRIGAALRLQPSLRPPRPRPRRRGAAHQRRLGPRRRRRAARRDGPPPPQLPPPHLAQPADRRHRLPPRDPRHARRPPLLRRLPRRPRRQRAR
jgi:uncharacterized protein